MSRSPRVDRVDTNSRREAERRGRRANARKAAPGLESLEERMMLSGATAKVSAAIAELNRTYIQGLIGDNHSLTAREVALSKRLTTELNAGVPRTKVAEELLRSLPALGVQARAVSIRMLGRTPTVAEMGRSVRIMERAGDQRGLIVAVASSNEYYRVRGEGTLTGFVQALYHDILQRQPTADESAAAIRGLKRGATRADLARRLIGSRESSELIIEGLRRQEGVRNASATDREFAVLARPGGQIKLTAQTIASDAVYDAIVGPKPATPPTPTASYNAHPPGFPISPGFDLVSRVQKLNIGTGTINTATNGIAAAADGSLWLAGGFGVVTYDVNSGLMLSPVTASFSGNLVAPLSKTEAYAAVTNQGAAGPTIIHISDGAYTNLPALPNSDAPAQMSASTDGLLWVVGSSGTLYSYASGTRTWSTVALQGNTFKQISVGSATNIVALTSAGVVLRYTPANGFQTDPDVTGTVAQVQATADGSLWADVTTGTGYVVYVKPSYGTFQPAPIQPGGGTTPVWLAAGNMYRAYQASLDPSNFHAQIDFLDIGVVDRQASPYPEFVGEAEQAYLGLSQAADVFVPAGVRSLYNTPGIDWGTISSNIATAVCPSTIDPTVWGDVQTELKTEINYVGTVYGRLDLMKSLITAIQVVNDGALDAAEPIVGLSKPNGPDKGSIIGVILQDLLEAIAGAISSTGIPPAGAVAAAMLAAGLDDALAAIEQSNPPGPNGAVAIEYSSLKTTMDDLFLASYASISSSLTSLVTDQGRAQAVAEAILNGVWPYPNGTGTKIAQESTEAFNLYFYQSLTAAKWQIVHTKWLDYTQYPFLASVDIPDYDNYEIALGHEDGYPVAEEYFANQIGSQVNLNSKDLGPFPIEQLIENVGFLVGASFEDFWTGKNGWQLVKSVRATV